MAKTAEKVAEKPADKLVAIQTKITQEEAMLLDQARRMHPGPEIPSRAELMREIVFEHLKAKGIRLPKR
jgi:hypothetical protein